MQGEHVLRILHEHRAELSALGARRLALFGSFARGEARPDSDVDLLVELDERTFDRYMDLKLHLEDLLGRRVDLVLFDRIKPALREAILASAIDAA
jgi:predicted nucleotidyltransferase